MKTEKLKQNVKGYVQQFEDGGLRLLRKGQKGVIHAIFSRFGLVLILLLLQVGLLFSIFRWFGNLWPHYFGGSVVAVSYTHLDVYKRQLSIPRGAGFAKRKRRFLLPKQKTSVII